MVPYTSEASLHEYLKGGLGLPNKALWYTFSYHCCMKHASQCGCVRPSQSRESQ